MSVKIIAFTIFSLISIQLPAQDYWAGFSNVRYDGNYFYAVANRLFQVVKINKQGQVIASFGKRGKGPKEFVTDQLELAQSDSLLYVLDDRGMTVTTLNKGTFKFLTKRIIKKPASNLIFYERTLYGYIMDFEKADPFKTGKLIKAFRPVGQLKNSETTLFEVIDNQPINPFYDGEAVYSTGNSILITRDGRSDFVLFSNDSLYKKQIPGVEPYALGKVIKKDSKVLDRPEAKVFWKKKIMPAYILMKSAYLQGGKAYFQLYSYKAGNVLIRYNVVKDTFTTIGALSSGTLIAIDQDTVYTLNNSDIDRTTLENVRSCSTTSVVIYLRSKAFTESCDACSDSFSKWYMYAKRHNIPVKLFLENTSWFGLDDVKAASLAAITQWGVWGAIRYKKKCEGCFKSPISAKIVSEQGSSKLYSFPEPVSILQQKLSCIKN